MRSEGGKPTEQALSEEYCKSTPLKDGTPFFMWNKQKVAGLMQANGHQKLNTHGRQGAEVSSAQRPQEVKARELADDWVRINKQFQEAVYGIEEEMCIEESIEVKKEAKRRGLTERVNEILQERKFKGELIV